MNILNIKTVVDSLRKEWKGHYYSSSPSTKHNLAVIKNSIKNLWVARLMAPNITLTVSGKSKVKVLETLITLVEGKEKEYGFESNS